MRDAEFVTAGEVLSLGAGAVDESEGEVAEEVSGAGAGDASVADGLSVGLGASVEGASLADGARVGSAVG